MPLNNQILARLSKRDRSLINGSMEVVDLKLKQVLETPANSVRHAYFVRSGLISVVATAVPNHRIEVAMIGSEGMSGISLLLGDDRTANEAIVQSSGTALRVTSANLQKAIRQSTTLSKTLLRYTQALTIQASQTALANGRGRIEERLARWLSMWRDRLHDDEIFITHQFLSTLLGVRRAGITVAINELEGRGLLKATRTQIKVVDRKGLREAANGFYGVAELEYRRLLGGNAKRSLA